MAILEHIHLRPEHMAQIIEHIAGEAPLEACGIVAGQHDQSLKVYPITNILQSPVRYEMDPQQQVRAMIDLEGHGWELLAIYHSHPNGPAAPSPTDINESYYPEAVYLIFSPEDGEWKCRGFVIDEKQVYEVKITAV